MNKKNYMIGDIIKTKKPHACGSDLWEITRVGIDIKIKCQGCGREVLMMKTKFDRKLKENIGPKA